MPVVIIGADVSGNITGGGQSRHIAVVIGTEESINKIYQKNRLGRNPHVVSHLAQRGRIYFKN